MKKFKKIAYFKNEIEDDSNIYFHVGDKNIAWICLNIFKGAFTSEDSIAEYNLEIKYNFEHTELTEKVSFTKNNRIEFKLANECFVNVGTVKLDLAIVNDTDRFYLGTVDIEVREIPGASNDTVNDINEEEEYINRAIELTNFTVDSYSSSVDILFGSPDKKEDIEELSIDKITLNGAVIDDYSFISAKEHYDNLNNLYLSYNLNEYDDIYITLDYTYRFKGFKTSCIVKDAVIKNYKGKDFDDNINFDFNFYKQNTQDGVIAGTLELRNQLEYKNEFKLLRGLANGEVFNFIDKVKYLTQISNSRSYTFIANYSYLKEKNIDTIEIELEAGNKTKTLSYSLVDIFRSKGIEY